MRLEDFDYELPPELIAQYPLPQRDDSRLMVLDRANGSTRTGKFTDIARFFRRGDLLVINDTRVIPARLLGFKESGGKVEVFLVRRLSDPDETWVCLVKCSKAPKPGSRLLLAGGIEGTVLAGGESPYRHVRFSCPGDFFSTVEQAGRIPLPPYIRRDDDAEDRRRYQTVFARNQGAVAAPTAGLHFTEAVFADLRDAGVKIEPLTLHVGLGTFLPVRVDDIREHRMHGENYHVPESTADAVNRARAEGRRIFALGTTTTRTLEHAVGRDGRVRPGEGASDLFIYPGYRFRIVDALVTNFHLPRSTLLMLVSAFAGRDNVLAAYRRAVAEKYRFFSYGDCMLIL